MTTYRPAQIFASVNTNPTPQKHKTKAEPTEEKTKPSRSNEIEVTATAELSLLPDRCRVTISVSTKKDDAQDAKNSVSRRLDYALQTLQNHQVKEGDIQVAKVLQRVDGLFHFDAQICVTFVDFHKCQAVCNFLVEKLDDSVKISVPEFSQSPQRLENLRRQVSLAAVKNAKQKAGEMARFLHASVGSSLGIREEYCNEWEGPNDASYDPEAPITMQQRIAMATVFVQAKVTASFELKTKTNKKKD